MKNLVDIIKDIVDSINREVSVISIDGDKVFLNETLYITIGHVIEDLEGNKWKVTEIQDNDYIRVEAYGHELVFSSSKVFAKEITYLHGDPISTNNEYLNESRLTSEKTPFIWLVESYTYEDLPRDSSVSSAFDVRLFLMDWAPDQWFNDDHNNYAIKPLSNLQEALKSVIEQDYMFKTLDTLRPTVRNRFGDVNNNKLIIDERLSGIELNFKLEIFAEGCSESNVTSCFPVDITVNGELMTSAKSGDTINIEIDDTLGDPQGVRQGESFRYVVPAGFEVVRLYAPPPYSGSIDRGDLYDSYWRKVNNVGNLTQPIIGIQMRYAFGSQYLLDPDTPGGNVFGNYAAYTGTTGGWLDWDTGIYYDVDGIVTTRELAYPDGIAVNHVWGMLVQIDQSGADPRQTWMDEGQTLTIGGFTEWYLPSFTEIAVMCNFGVRFGYNDPPLFDWGSGLKFTSDTYPSSTSQAMSAQSYSHITSRTKTSSSKAIYIKYIDINAEFGT